jgi:hypothetical protein
VLVDEEALGDRGLYGWDALRGPGLTSPFRTWDAVDRHILFPGVAICVIGGEQVMLCHLTYEPSTTVRRHSHPTAKQVVWIVRGDVTMTIGDETKTLGARDVVVCTTFVEALAPVLRDHVPDAKRNLVLGEQGGLLHAEA